MTCLRVHAQLDDLERHAPPHRFLLFGHINHAAAALADLLEQLVAADAVAGLFGDGENDVRSSLCARRIRPRRRGP